MHRMYWPTRIAGEAFIRAPVVIGAALALLVCAPLPGAFAAYPEQPVRFIVPWPPGELEDRLTRLIAARMAAETGVTATVINRPGGDGPFPGAAEVARAAADGYTVGAFASGVTSVAPLKGVPGIERDSLEPVGIFLTHPFVLAAGGTARYADMTGLARFAAGNAVVLGHPGYESLPTRAMVIAGLELGFEFASDAYFEQLDCTTLADGDVDVIVTTLQRLLPCLNRVRVLASLTEARLARLPGVATLGEQVRGVDVTSWNGLFVPRGTPAKVKSTLAAVARAAVLGTDAQRLAGDAGALVYWQDEGEARGRVDADYRRVQAMFRRMGDL